MAENIFENYQNKKNEIIQLADKAKEFGFISEKSHGEIIEKLKTDILTIGVIGQMKCGKSTFLNAFVFEDDILPSATTPMTASLCVITYGETKKIVAEFYTKEEWEEQKTTASRSLENISDELEKSKIQAAQELVQKSKKLGDALPQFLGKTTEDSFDNLIEYVGANGKYISITKSVKIYYPKEYLKGVEIVDTPGLNDPIVSREERTKEFLNRADVVLMLLYAGRPFDATDHNILFENVRKCGTGKVLIGINKYDIPYENGDCEDEIKNYVIGEIKKACKKYDDDSISEILKDVEPVLLSANMALLSQIPLEKINASEGKKPDYKFDWDRYCDMFEISNQKEFKEKSYIDILGKYIIDLIEKEKGRILFKKPINQILAGSLDKKSDIERKIQLNKNEISLLETPDDELKEKEKNLQRATKSTTRKLDALKDEIEGKYDETIRDGCKKLEKCAEKISKELLEIIDGKTFLDKFANAKKIRDKLDWAMIGGSKDLKNCIDETVCDLNNKLRKEVLCFFQKVDEIFDSYLEIDIGVFSDGLKRKIKLQIDDNTLNYCRDMFEKPLGPLEAIKEALFEYGGFEAIFENIKKALEGKEQFEEKAKDFYRNFNPQKYFKPVSDKKDEIIKEIEKEFIGELLEPMQEQLEECKNNLGKREENLKAALAEKERLVKEKRDVEKQIQEINALAKC